MECPDCGKEMECIDTTFSNVNTEYCKKGDHTGNIYRCDICQIFWIDDFLSNKIHPFHYN